MIHHSELLKLKRWNTPTICNGWEQVTKHDTGRDGFNFEETTDFMDNNECNTLIAAARNATGKPVNQILKELNDASAEFGKAVKEKFGSNGI